MLPGYLAGWRLVKVGKREVFRDYFTNNQNKTGLYVFKTGFIGAGAFVCVRFFEGAD